MHNLRFWELRFASGNGMLCPGGADLSDPADHDRAPWMGWDRQWEFARLMVTRDASVCLLPKEIV